MPQMAPILRALLSIFFILTLSLFLLLNYLIEPFEKKKDLLSFTLFLNSENYNKSTFNFLSFFKNI